MIRASLLTPSMWPPGFSVSFSPSTLEHKLTGTHEALQLGQPEHFLESSAMETSSCSNLGPNLFNNSLFHRDESSPRRGLVQSLPKKARTN